MYKPAMDLLARIMKAIFGSAQKRRGAAENLQNVPVEKNTERTLRESELKYRTLFEAANDAIFLVRNFCFVECNNRTLEIYGCKREDILGMPPQKFSPPVQPDGRSSNDAAMEKMRLALSGVPQFFEWQHIRLDGTTFMAEVSLNRLELADGVALQAIVRDISERKKIEAELIDLSAHHESLLAAISDIVMEVDANKIYTWANQAGYDFFGADVIGKEAAYFFEGEQTTYQTVGPLFNGKEDVFYVESWQRRRDGQKRLLAWWCRNMKDHRGNVVGAISSARDITDIKKAEEILKRQKMQLQNISDNLGDAMLYQVVVHKDDSRQCTYVSGKVKEFYGVSPDEMMKDISLLYRRIHPDDRERVAKDEYKAWDAMRPLKTEARMINPDGSLRWSYFVSVPKPMAGGAVSWDGIEFDITERKKAEVKLQKALEAKSAFTSMVSHELRTPLTVIKESIYLMSSGALGSINEKQKRHLEMENKNVDRLSRLLGEILDYQSLESGKFKFHMAENDINEVVKDVFSQMNPLVTKKGLEFKCNCDESLSHFVFDKDRITEVVVNLFNNAMKLTESGHIIVSTSKHGGFIRVSVSDTGPGIKEEDMPRLFKQFEQLKRMPGGTGLGLAICKDIINAHNGKIWAESVAGNGATFHFELPLKN